MARLKARIDKLYQAQESARLAAGRRLLVTGGWVDPVDSACLLLSWGADPDHFEGWEPPADAQERAARAWAAMLQHATPAERLLLDLPEVAGDDG